MSIKVSVSLMVIQLGFNALVSYTSNDYFVFEPLLQLLTCSHWSRALTKRDNILA